MAEVYTGVCVGGPLDTQSITVRSPAGFLAADKVNGAAWIYKRGTDGRFTVCTDHDDSLAYPYGPSTGVRALQPERAAAAAARGDLDVVAVRASGGV